jgi:phosphoribosylglycinamide formyltransferase-1
MQPALPIAVLLSGSGRTLANILAKIDDDRLGVRVVAVASDRTGVRGIEIAREAGLPARVFSRRDHPDRSERDLEMWSWLHSHRPELVCLAGYLSLLELRGGRGVPVLNIHPALLPAYGGKGFYGDRVHRAVLEHGERESGATVHVVNERFDEGALVARIVVPVLEGDDAESLARRVFAAECELYPQVLRWCAEGELWVEEGRPMGAEGPWKLRTLVSPDRAGEKDPPEDENDAP